MPTSPDADLQLPAELTIYTAAETRAVWLSWLAAQAGDGGRAAANHEAVCRVDAAAVDQVDAAGLQLLVSLRHRLAHEDCSLQLLQASTALRSACNALGLSDLLDGSCSEAKP